MVILKDTNTGKYLGTRKTNNANGDIDLILVDKQNASDIELTGDSLWFGDRCLNRGNSTVWFGTSNTSNKHKNWVKSVLDDEGRIKMTDDDSFVGFVLISNSNNIITYSTEKASYFIVDYE